MDQEIIDMAVMYAAICKRTEKLFWYWQNCTSCKWQWEDLVAAFELLHERNDRWQLWNTSEHCKILQELGTRYTQAMVYQYLHDRLALKYGWNHEENT